MATPTYVNDVDLVGGVASSHDVTLTGVTSGNLLVLVIFNATASRPQPTLSDNQSNSWSWAEYLSASGFSEAIGIAYAVAGSTGDVTVTVTWTGNENSNFNLIEINGQAGTPLDTSDSIENSSGTSHVCANTGLIDTSANVIVVSAGTAGANLGTITVPSGYTQLYNSSTGSWSAYDESDSAKTDEQGSWSCSISRATVCAIASFVGSAGGATVAAKSIMRGANRGIRLGMAH